MPRVFRPVIRTLAEARGAADKEAGWDTQPRFSTELVRGDVRADKRIDSAAWISEIW